MALDRQEVRRIAALARLDLTPAEEALLVEQLGQIVDFFDHLRDFAPVAGTPAAGTPAAEELAVDDRAPVMGGEAEERTQPCLPRDEFLRNAPQSFEGFLVVPRVKPIEPR